jgi:hypothetical protein
MFNEFGEQQDFMEQDFGATNTTAADDGFVYPQQLPAPQQQQQQPQPGGYSVGLESPMKGKPTKNHSLLPVTIRQLHTATQSHPEDTVFRIDGQDLNEVTIVGQILSRKDGQTNLTFHIDDGTGGIFAKVWIGENDEETQQRHQQLREGMYVRAIGQLRAFNAQRNLVAFRIRPVTDFNEITFHFLDVIYTHSLNLGIIKAAIAPLGGLHLPPSNNTNTFYRAPPLDNDLTPLQRAVRKNAAPHTFLHFLPCYVSSSRQPLCGLSLTLFRLLDSRADENVASLWYQN